MSRDGLKARLNNQNYGAHTRRPITCVKLVNMEIPYQLLIFSIPSLILVGIYRWRVGESWRSSFAKVGWQGSKLIYFIWSFVVLVAVGGLAWLAIKLIPAELFQSEHLNISKLCFHSEILFRYCRNFLIRSLLRRLGRRDFLSRLVGRLA